MSLNELHLILRRIQKDTIWNSSRNNTHIQSKKKKNQQKSTDPEQLIV